MMVTYGVDQLLYSLFLCFAGEMKKGKGLVVFQTALSMKGQCTSFACGQIKSQKEMGNLNMFKKENPFLEHLLLDIQMLVNPL